MEENEIREEETKLKGPNDDGAEVAEDVETLQEVKELPASDSSAASPMNMKAVGALVAIVAVVLIIILVRMFACSAAAAPNLVDVATKPSNEVANILKTQKEMSVQGFKVYTNNEEFVTTIENETGEEQLDMKKYDGSYLMMIGEDSDILSMEDVNGGADPTRVSLMQVVSGDSLSAKDVADRVAKMAPYENVYVVALASDEYFSGSAMGNGCVSEFTATKRDGVWALMVNVYSVDEDASGASKADSFTSAFDSINPENYADCYKA